MGIPIEFTGMAETSLETEMQGIENLRMCCCLSVCFFCSRQQPRDLSSRSLGTFPQFFATLKNFGGTTCSVGKSMETWVFPKIGVPQNGW